ncbi:MAG: gfo/Idh/MocA family oxidoreductase, partial [Microbacterium sp.]
MSGDSRALRVGVVGLGWAGQQHLKGYAALDGVEIIGIAGQEEELLASLGDEYGAEHRVTRWQELIEVPGLD